VTSQWRYILKHLAWYVSMVILLVVLVYVFHLRSFLWLPWLVAIGWGVGLIFLLRQTDETASVETRLQGYLNQARAYQAQIDSVVKTSPNWRDSAALSNLAAQVNNWTQAIEELVKRINTLQQDHLIRQDIKAVPKAIEALEARLARETEPTIQTQLERTLANRKKQLAALEQLQTIMTRAEIQIESTLSMLGTIYSQILTGQSTSHVADYSRLSTDVDEEVRLLQDQLEALQEVKLKQE
jgi:hypothetical protein